MDMNKKIFKSSFEIPKMDCPSEENIIRMKLSEVEGIKNLDFNLNSRMLNIVHENSSEIILSALIPLGFGARLASTSQIDADTMMVHEKHTPEEEARVLKLLLLINLGMFILEIIIGIYSQSMGVISDSLDMLADSIVYFLSLIAVGKSLMEKHRAAKFSGYFQLVLAIVVLAETVRKFFVGSEPLAQYMIVISVVALIANLGCLLLLSKFREGEAHMRASWIFSSNDVIANIGVILAGVLVTTLDSNLPDLIIGALVGLVVLKGSFTILKISK
jgi:Co/Zn/Cd efflux system component